jgi:transcriptional regulator with XRE-family HTH domain
MRIYKTNEKVLLWMKRNGYDQSYIANKLGVTRQTLAKRLQDNFFSVGDIIILKSLGFEE